MRLDPAAQAAGTRLLQCETLASTNAEALTRARAGDCGPLWITAQRQTAGRGRRGNAWISEPGNLYATLLLGDPAPPHRAAELSFVAALAVHDAIMDCSAALSWRLALKWPNDVLCDGAKLAGMLIESEHVAGTLAVAIGIGVNCAHHPDGTSYPATDLATAGVSASHDTIFGGLSAAMARRLAQWQGGAGFPSIRTDWLERAVGVGSDMLVRLPGRELTGKFEALDERGRLLLRLPDGALEAVSAGDVFPLTAKAQAHAAAPGEVA
jgi:BirA family biotin operon repressor/biotin-[acetyl-CoA-carboxylase] ligase